MIKKIDTDFRGKAKIEGQFFDMNGKSVGIRIRIMGEPLSYGEDAEEDKVMDLRFKPQAPMMPPMKSVGHQRSFAYINEVRTNVREKIGSLAHDSSFSLILQPPTTVRYSVSDIYERSRQWKQRNLIFCQMVITHWLIFCETVRRFHANPESAEWRNRNEGLIAILTGWTNATVSNYVSVFINVHEQRSGDEAAAAAAPERVEDPIMSMAVLETHDDIGHFQNYLERIYPSVFYKEVFHVERSELERVRSYMERELDVIQSYPPEFSTHFKNMRLNTDLFRKQSTRIEAGRGTVILQTQLSSTEFIGQKHIDKDNHTTLVKANRLSNLYYMRVDRFNPMMDPLSTWKKGEKFEKAELIMTEIGGKLYFLRLTRSHHIEVACNICHMWKTQRQLLSYEETGTRNTAVRRYHIVKDEIVEHNNNDEEQIQLTGEDYRVLHYERVTYSSSNGRVTYVAMLPLE
jgi:hypothetical protein